MTQARPDRPAGTQADLAFDRLEQLLVTLRLPPGSSVREQELAERVELGRTPVREAVQRLSALGLLRVFPRKGLVVAAVERSDLVQVLEVRRVLERLLVVKAAERATHDQRRALRAIAVHLDGITDDVSRYLQLDRSLDDLLLTASGNPYLRNALAPMHVHCRRLWYLNLPRVDLSSAATFHAALARSVADGDGGGAVRALNGIITLLDSLVNDLDRLE